MMQRRDEEAGCNADALRHVVILESHAILELPIALGEDDYQPGRDLEMRL